LSKKKRETELVKYLEFAHLKKN